MSNYLCLELQCSENPLKKHFPHPSLMKYLCVPAMSVLSERAFSVAGYIVNKNDHLKVSVSFLCCQSKLATECKLQYMQSPNFYIHRYKVMQWCVCVSLSLLIIEIIKLTLCIEISWHSVIEIQVFYHTALSYREEIFLLWHTV